MPRLFIALELPEEVDGRRWIGCAGPARHALERSRTSSI